MFGRADINPFSRGFVVNLLAMAVLIIRLWSCFSALALREILPLHKSLVIHHHQEWTLHVRHKFSSICLHRRTLPYYHYYCFVYMSYTIRPCHLLIICKKTCLLVRKTTLWLFILWINTKCTYLDIRSDHLKFDIVYWSPISAIPLI